MLPLIVSVGRVQLTDLYGDELLNVTRISFAVFAGLCLVGMYAFFVRGPRREE